MVVLESDCVGADALIERRADVARRIIGLFRAVTWGCIVGLAILSLLPAQDMVRTGFGHHLEHFGAYAGSAAIAVLGYGQHRRPGWIIVGFGLYGGLLESLQYFSPGRSPAIADFVVSLLGALFGALTVLLLRSRYPALLPRS